MSFLGGTLVGGIVGIGLGVLIARPRRGRGAPDALPPGRRSARSRSAAVGAATLMAAAALVVSGVALARSDRHDGGSARASNTTTTAAAPALTPSTATPTTSLGTTVSVPNVVALSRDSAEASIKNAGLKPVVETLSLSNVPANFVISQNPLPAAQVPVGTSVSLVVSAAT